MVAVPLFQMEGVSKSYGGVRALEKAGLIVEAGRGQLGRHRAHFLRIFYPIMERMKCWN